MIFFTSFLNALAITAVPAKISQNVFCDMSLPTTFTISSFIKDASLIFEPI